MKVPGSKSSIYKTFVPGSESMWERKFHNSCDSMDRYGIPALPWPPGKHTGTFSEKRTYWYACRPFSEI